MGDRNDAPPAVGPRRGRLILVSNRLPITIVRAPRGHEVRPSAGGLATALWPMHQAGESVWVGWPGELPGDAGEAKEALAAARERRLIPVSLDDGDIEAYYHGFCNSTLWPLFHYLSHATVLDRGWWEAYRRVNARFAGVVTRVYSPGDTVWVHDYHLMLLPGILRERLVDARIGFFLHIPFPSAEIFRILPWRRDLLRGLLGADLIGFHVYDYLLHFRFAARRVLGAEGQGDRLKVEGRNVELGAFPVGVDAERFSRQATEDPETRSEITGLREELRGRTLILGVDRMDYTKGLPERLVGYESFLERYPRFQGRVEFIQISVPTRTRVDEYRDLRLRVEGIVGRINGRFGTSDWTPVKYLYRPVPFHRLCALYRHAGVMLVTPLRDGMNLVAKEYVASKRNGGDGVLILSEFAGAATELGDALLVNPYDTESIAAALYQALVMPAAERRARMLALIEQVWQRDVRRWGESFLRSLVETNTSSQVFPPRLAGPARLGLKSAWGDSRERLVLLDYDGTLLKIFPRPELARPDRALMTLLAWLAKLRGVSVVVVSGRDRTTLEGWLGSLPVGLVAEHGRWMRHRHEGWEDLLDGRSPMWLAPVTSLFREAAETTPGSLVEVKTASVAWHYRGVNPEQADTRARELMNRLEGLPADPPINIIQGKCVIEARVAGINKGSAILALLADRPPTDFLFAAGDDETDEQLFAQLPPTAWSIHIGSSSSRARFSLPDPGALRALLQELGSVLEKEA
ncbi:MAG: bifunctional alpha,alpha-trehalose-phosphate synthase (UDP-forming)/trehalose-phosphatase [Acidobacteriota bacterium]